MIRSSPHLWTTQFACGTCARLQVAYVPSSLRQAPAHHSEQGLLNLPSSPVVTYDTSGMVFAVALNKYSRVLMYDAKNVDKQPFTSPALHDPTLHRLAVPARPLPIACMDFSSNGSYL